MRPKICLLSFLLLLFTAGSLFSLQWQTWRSGDLIVTAAPKDSAYANMMLRSLQKRINTFQMELGVYPHRQLKLQILPNRKEYARLTTGKGKLVEASEAFYSPQDQVIYVRSPEQLANQNYDAVLMHEYIHWFLDETLCNVPLWFHEGMAMYYSGQFNFDAYYNFTRYRFMGQHLSLDSMNSSYPSDRSQWNMFYLTSVFAVNYLQSHHKKEWQKFWDTVGYYYNRKSADSASRIDFLQVFHYAYRMSLVAFSQEFDKTARRYTWLFPLIGLNALIFALLPFVILIAWRRSRKKLKAMPDFIIEDDEEEDEPEQPSEND